MFTRLTGMKWSCYRTGYSFYNQENNLHLTQLVYSIKCLELIKKARRLEERICEAGHSISARSETELDIGLSYVEELLYSADV